MVMLASSVAEVLSLAAVLPFLAVLTNPIALWNNQSINSLSFKLGITSPQDLLLVIALVFSLAAIAAGAIRLFTLWLNVRLAAAIGSDLSISPHLISALFCPRVAQ